MLSQKFLSIIHFLFTWQKTVTFVMNDSVTVERDGWSRQDNSPFERMSQKCSEAAPGTENELLIEIFPQKKF